MPTYLKFIHLNADWTHHMHCQIYQKKWKMHFSGEHFAVKAITNFSDMKFLLPYQNA